VLFLTLVLKAIAILLPLAIAIGLGAFGFAAWLARLAYGLSALKPYAHSTPVPGTLLDTSPVYVGPHLSGLRVAVLDQGLYLWSGRFPLLRLSRPLLIPWKDISFDPESESFQLGSRPVILRFRPAVIRRILPYLQDGQAIATIRCPFCHGALADRPPLGACVQCGTRHHAECLVEHGGCVVMGCGEAPKGVSRRQGAAVLKDRAVSEPAHRASSED